MNLIALLEDLKGTGALLIEQAPLSRYTTFCVGGPADLLYVPKGHEDIRRAFEACRSSGVPLHVLGGGSNLLVPDEGVRGLVLRLAEGLAELRFDGEHLLADAGVGDEVLAEAAHANGLAGFEWIYDIPGTVGGAVFMNAGNADGDMAQNVLEVTWMDLEGDLHHSAPDQLEFGYRTSLFHRRQGIILAARLAGTDERSPREIRAEMDRIRDLRRAKFPEETMCAGSVFKRPPGDYAGRLIEVSGCGGMRRGGAMVSNKHKGFIVNTGGARAEDVLELITDVLDRVQVETGVQLEKELEIFGDRPLL